MFHILSFRFFFFKQKTAYEMRISDWSSDVCSSDLRGLVDRGINLVEAVHRVEVEQRIMRAGTTHPPGRPALRQRRQCLCSPGTRWRPLPMDTLDLDRKSVV